MIIASLAKSYSQDVDTVKTGGIDKLEERVDYHAEDSIVFNLGEQKAYLYNKAKVKYGTINLESYYIVIDFANNTVHAKYGLDSLGNKIGKPIFEDGDTKTEEDEIIYNFKTKRGIIKNVRLQEGESYILVSSGKKQANDDLHIRQAKYTTCNLEHPHYYFMLSKAVVIPDDKIVSGPVNLWIADIPTPLGLPFGFFPNKKGGTNGVVIPNYGESQVLGFFLQNGGYYHKFGDKFDTQILGDIYSKGSWAVKNISNYKVRYKYTGNTDISYTRFRQSYPEFPDFSRQTEFFVRWNHQQDASARPGSRFSANVNAGTANNFRNNFNTNTQDYLSNTFQSSINWNKNWQGKPYNLNASLRHNQNSLNRQVNLTLPELAFNVNRQDVNTMYYSIFKQDLPRNKFFNQIGKIGVNFNTLAKNDISATDSLIGLNNINSLINSNMRNGMRHNMVANTQFKLLKQTVILNPAFTMTDRWYLQTIERNWNNDLQTVTTDTLRKFSRAGDWNFSMGLTTKLYGYYGFAGSLRGKRESVIRHVLTPNLSFVYNPSFSTNRTGYYGPNGTLGTYSPYQNGLFGAPPSNESGNINLNLLNSLEMKLRDMKDTLEKSYKKIMLVENFTINSGYDIFRDSLNFSNISMAGRTNLFKKLGLNYAASFDPYHYQNGIKINQSEYKQSGRFGRFMNANLATSLQLASKSKKPNKFNPVGSNLPIDENDETLEKPETDKELVRAISSNPYAYVDFDIPWTLNLAYNLNLNRSFINGRDTLLLANVISAVGDFSLTENWKIGFTTGYDIRAKDFTYTSIDIYRDLHCWEMQFNWIPFGPRQSYNIQINVKASVLQDLRLQRRRSWFDNTF